jgi:hypothetical protein
MNPTPTRLRIKQTDTSKVHSILKFKILFNRRANPGGHFRTKNLSPEKQTLPYNETQKQDKPDQLKKNSRQYI